LLLAPCIPKHWPRFEIVFQYASARYEIAVENPHRVSRGITHAEFDGQPLSEGSIRVPLHDDGTSHRIHAVLG
jgi:cyclic beta-1,2-glucan synthetase